MTGGEVLAYSGVLTIIFVTVLSVWVGIWAVLATPFILFALIGIIDRSGRA